MMSEDIFVEDWRGAKPQPRAGHFDRVSIAVHWLTVVLVATQFARPGSYCPVHMLGTKRLHNASFPSGRTRELCLDFFAAVATLNSLRDANLWGRGSMFEQRRGS